MQLNRRMGEVMVMNAAVRVRSKIQVGVIQLRMGRVMVMNGGGGQS